MAGAIHPFSGTDAGVVIAHAIAFIRPHVCSYCTALSHLYVLHIDSLAVYAADITQRSASRGWHQLTTAEKRVIQHQAQPCRVVAIRAVRRAVRALGVHTFSHMNVSSRQAGRTSSAHTAQHQHASFRSSAPLQRRPGPQLLVPSSRRVDQCHTVASAMKSKDALVQDAIVWASQHGLVVGLGERQC